MKDHSTYRSTGNKKMQRISFRERTDFHFQLLVDFRVRASRDDQRNGGGVCMTYTSPLHIG